MHSSLRLTKQRAEAKNLTLFRRISLLLGSIFVGVFILLVAGISYAAPAASVPAPVLPSCAANWNIVAGANPSTNNYLHGIDAVSANDMWAVGYYYHNSCPTCPRGTLIEHWDGTQWNQVPGDPVPTDRQGELNAVVAVSQNDVWAAGYYCPGNDCQTLIEHWDGTQWHIVPSPNRVGYNELKGIAAISANDIWAVGTNRGDHGTLTMHWNGSYWAIVPSPPDSGLYNYILTSVSAVATNDVWAVGYMEGQSGMSTPIIEHWNGTQWTLTTGARPGDFYTSLYGVTALAANDIWAVGAYSNDSGATNLPLMEHWDGTQWTAFPGNSTHPFNDLRSVSAASPNDVWAVGLSADCDLCLIFNPLIEHWDGTQWSEVPSVNGPNDFDRLRGVEAVSSGDVWTVGYSDEYEYPYPSQTLIERHTCAPTPTVTGTPPTATLTSTSTPSATPTVCSLSTTNYTIAQSANATVVPAANDIGLHCDYCSTSISLPFSFSLYGRAFNSVIAGNNGTLGFLANSNTWRTACLPSQEFDYAILPYWQQLHLDPTGGGCEGCGIFTSTHGIAPNRIFDIEWRAKDYFYTASVNVEVRLYENANNGHFEVIYGSVPSGGNQQVTVGVQKGRGDLYTQYVCENTLGTISNGTMLTFTQPVCNLTVTPTSVVPTRTTTPLTTSTSVPSTSTPVGSTPTSGTQVPTVSATSTSQGATATGTTTTIPTGSVTVIPTASACAVTFTDVPPGSTFYVYVKCLVCRGIVSGYEDGTFRPSNDVTRGQLAKIVSNAAEFSEPVQGLMFEDVAPESTFYLFVNRLASRGFISGYDCGGVDEPCNASGNGDLPYFRPARNATRGQIAKIVSNAAGYNDTPSGRSFEDVAPTSPFYTWIQRLTSRGIVGGYDCGGIGEACNASGNGDLPYFRPANNASRGQTAKIVANTFFPDCQSAGSERR